MSFQYFRFLFTRNIVILAILLFSVFIITDAKANDGKDNKQSFTSDSDYKYLETGKITKIRAGSVDTIHRLVFEVSKKFETEVQILNFPFRIVFNIPGPYSWEVLEKDLAEIVSTDYIEGFRYGMFDANTFRVVVDLNRAMVLQKSFLLDNKGKDGYRFVIDLRDVSGANANAKTVSRASLVDDKYTAIAVQSNNSLNLEAFSLFEEKLRSAQHVFFDNLSYPAPKIPDRKLIVTIDPGHGGKDPGAVTGDLQEKELVLDMSKRIGSILMKHPEVGVVLTRNDDFYVPLRDRVLISKYANSNLFVSIHADKAVTQDASGLSVYTLSEIASDASSYYIASNENKSDSIAGVSVNEDDEQVVKILNSLSQRYNLNESINLAGEILNKAQKNINLLENPRRSASFVVLKTNEIPSVLVEIGFLSNTDDVKFYNDIVNRNLAALSIADGILQYLERTGQLTVDYKPIVGEIEKAVLESKKKLEDRQRAIEETAFLEAERKAQEEAAAIEEERQKQESRGQVAS